MKIKLLALSLLSSLFTACGTDQQLQPGSSVVIDPAVRDIEIVELLDANGLCIFSEDNFLDSPVAIRVLDSTGGPVGNADLTVYTDWSGNTFPNGFEALKLYEDRNGNGVVDDPAELVSGASDAIFRTETDEFNGDKLLLLRINLSCGYRGQVYAISDGITGGMDIQIRAGN